MALAEYGNALNIDTDGSGKPILVDPQSGDTIAIYDRGSGAWQVTTIEAATGDFDSVNAGDATIGSGATVDSSPIGNSGEYVPLGMIKFADDSAVTTTGTSVNFITNSRESSPIQVQALTDLGNLEDEVYLRLSGQLKNDTQGETTFAQIRTADGFQSDSQISATSTSLTRDFGDPISVTVDQYIDLGGGVSGGEGTIQRLMVYVFGRLK